MQSSTRVLAAATLVAATAWLSPVAVRAQSPPPASVEQARTAFREAGFRVDPAYTWDWTTPMSSFHVYDQTQDRVVLVLVYPSSAAAARARAEAWTQEESRLSTETRGAADGPHLVTGYGRSLWRGNVALVQTTEATLRRVNWLQSQRDDGVYVEPAADRSESDSLAMVVDVDFLQALDGGAINL
jgi:hypothetical protein